MEEHQGFSASLYIQYINTYIYIYEHMTYMERTAALIRIFMAQFQCIFNTNLLLTDNVLI